MRANNHDATALWDMVQSIRNLPILGSNLPINPQTIALLTTARRSKLDIKTLKPAH
jgi:hypothetical protein